MRRLVIALVALGSMVVSGPVLAAPILEAEPFLQATNNAFFLAEAIPESAFTTPVPPTVFGGYATATVTGEGGTGDVDFYSFFTNAGEGYFDIDNDPFTFNMSLSLFDPSGTLIAFADDAIPIDPGSGDDRDSFLGVYTFTTAGTYYLAVSEAANRPTGIETIGGFTALLRPDGAFFGGGTAVTGATPADSSFNVNDSPEGGAAYTLHLSLQSPGTDAAPIPEPAMLLLFGTGLAAAAVRRYGQPQK